MRTRDRFSEQTSRVRVSGGPQLPPETAARTGTATDPDDVAVAQMVEMSSAAAPPVTYRNQIRGVDVDLERLGSI